MGEQLIQRGAVGDHGSRQITEIPVSEKAERKLAQSLCQTHPPVGAFPIGCQIQGCICRGQVSDFQMNKICAAGTGSFVEEQASHMGISLKQFGILALQAQAPAELGERCTVFIESAIRSAQAQGVGQADIAAGLCRSIVRNYLHKVVGSKTVGKHIVLQGGVAYNPGIVAAFQEQFAGRLTVSPVFSISGAYGVALLALESVQGSSCFHGFDKPVEVSAQRTQDVQENILFYQKASQLL